MSYYWLLVTLWFGQASLQHINSEPPSQEVLLEDSDLATPYNNYYHLPAAASDFEAYQRERDHATTGTQLNFGADFESVPFLHRLRRTAQPSKEEEQWIPNTVDSDGTTYVQNDKYNDLYPYLLQSYGGALDDNGTEVMGAMDKKSFSPWGGKRSDLPSFENMWTWKRALAAREPSMPKRVRFSPWGGKRSGQIIVKPSPESSRLFLASLPELTRILSNYYPNNNNQNLGDYQLVPSSMKNHPINILTLNEKMKDGGTKESLPFKRFFESIPQIFKPGHPYQTVNLKKDGKRKVKFSAWGGKRSPPIIGPIWTPTAENLKEPTLNALLFFRNINLLTKSQ